MGDNGEAAQPISVTVVSESRNLKARPFIPSDDQLATGKAWEDWLEQIEREFRFFKITQAMDRKDALIIFGGNEIARLEKNLPNPENTGEVPLDDYELLKKKINAHFLPQKNKHHARYILLKMRPEPEEPTAVYAARLREKANECEFGANEDERILEHLIQTVENPGLIQRAVRKGWNLSQFLTEAAQTEETNLQMKDMNEKPAGVKAVKHKKQISHPPRYKHHSFSQRTSTTKEKPSHQALCEYCDKRGTHEPGRDCPAYGEKCFKCGKMNHFARACKSTPKQPTIHPKKAENVQRHYQKKKVKKTKEVEDSASSDDDFIKAVANHITAKVKKVKNSEQNSDIVELQLNDVIIQAEADSGAEVNVMDEHQFQALKHRTKTEIKLEKSRFSLSALQTKLEVKGEFTATLSNKTRGTKATVIVVRGRNDSLPLLGRPTLRELGMLKIVPDGSLREKNDLRIRCAKEDPTKKPTLEIVNRHNKVFEGIGKIYDYKNDKEFYARFNMKPEAAPVAQKPRPVPYYLQTPLKQWLQQGIEADLFEEVKEGEPVTWCSPLVVQPKPKFRSSTELEPHMIRASVDLRVPNKFMERTRITQGPMVEDFTHKFHDCTVFSKLDLRQGYHQLVLDPECRAVATFSTPWGNMRPKRLIFGAKSSQDVFDETMYRIFGDIPKCMNQRDDILIGGRDMANHNKTLEAVLKRAEDFGITFNKEKCAFGVEELDFYGYKFTNEGLKPAPDKVRAIHKMEQPENKEAVRSFLGMTGYLSKFIPRYSSITAPLRELTHKGTKFRWGAEEAKAFQDLKRSITSQETMMYFNPKRTIIVRAEASYNEGLSGGLFQQTERGLQPVHFISRTMTDTEKRYSQTEKDALAIAWTKKRFRMYLLGAPKFKIITSHKPLLPMFNRTTFQLPPRIEKWVMEMQDVDFELEYQPGKDAADPLDYLSRHPLPETEEDATEHMIKQIVAEEHAIILKDLQVETDKDEQLQKLKAAITAGNWEKEKEQPDIAPYFGIKDQLFIAEGLIFRNKQIVIPRRLQRKVIKAAHSLGHLGMTKTKQMLREKYWFPRMDMMIEDLIGKCYECQVTTKEHRNEPLKMTNIPEKPWEEVATDFGGPYPDGHYNLVIIDKRSRFPVVETIYSTSAQPTIRAMKRVFAMLGTPKRIDSDNGPPFNSKEFAKFAEIEGFKHHRVTPEHPRANGEAESFMKLINKTEQISKIRGEDREMAMQNMLIGYRSTPHPATGVTPYEGITNRQIRTRIDHMIPEAAGNEDNKPKKDREQKITERDQEYKDKLKRKSENKNTKEHKFNTGDYVLLKQKKTSKWSTAYEPAFYMIYRIDGSAIAARRVTDGRELVRDASQFKLANQLITQTQDNPTTEKHDWREKALRTPQKTGLKTKPPTDAPQMEEEIDSDPVMELEPEEERTVQRPEREKRRPTYLHDYVVKI